MRAPHGRPVTLSTLVASVLVAAIVGGAVAAGVTLGIMRLQSRTNPQRVDLSSGVTIKEDDATTAVALKAAPAVVSIVTQQTGAGQGSGFLVTSDGYIVTNVGVVANAQSLTVLLSADSRRHDARLVDYDCTIGVAVLKVDQVSNLPTLGFESTADLRPGQSVIVVGGSLAEQGAVTRGVISRLHAVVNVTAPYGAAETQLSDVIRTDAQIDRSLSGAPLLNVGGHVVGITMAATSAGQPAAFALPAGDLQAEVEQIVQGETLVVPSLAADTQDVSAGLAVVQGGPPGARIRTVTASGPADRAGLRAGDVITQLDEQKLDDAHPLPQILRAGFKPDQRVTVSYWRAGTTGQVQLSLLGEHPACG